MRGSSSDEPTAEAPAAPRPLRQKLAPAGPLLGKLALELFIVFIGVSAAFAVENYRDARNEDARRQVVYRALDRELMQMAETHGPVLQRQMAKQLAAWDRALARGEKPLPPDFRIPDAERPPTGVWDAAVASGTIELVEPELMFGLARFYTRANSAGDLYQRYAAAAQVSVWPHLQKGPSAFWESNGDLRDETAAHIQRLRDFSERQGRLSKEARVLRESLKGASGD